MNITALLLLLNTSLFKLSSGIAMMTWNSWCAFLNPLALLCLGLALLVWSPMCVQNLSDMLLNSCNVIVYSTVCLFFFVSPTLAFIFLSSLFIFSSLILLFFSLLPGSLSPCLCLYFFVFLSFSLSPCSLCMWCARSSTPSLPLPRPTAQT